MSSETVPVRRAALEQLLEGVERVIRRHGGPEVNGNGELASSVEAVVRDVAAADLRERLAKSLPVPVPAEEEAG